MNRPDLPARGSFCGSPISTPTGSATSRGTIRWDSQGNDGESLVSIDLYQDGPHGPALLLHIATTADDGQHTWIPFDDSGIDFGTYGLRIVVSLVDHPRVTDGSIEPFSVPEDGSEYYVNVAGDGNLADNEYTLGPGSNRQTGKRPDAPKPNPINVLRVYEVTGGATLSVDPGTYPLIDLIELSGSVNHGLGLDRGFTLQGPAVPGAATLTPANLSVHSPHVVLLDDADLTIVRQLSLVGGTSTLEILNGTTDARIEDVILSGMTTYGVFLDDSYDDVLEGITITGNPGELDNPNDGTRDGVHVESLGDRFRRLTVNDLVSIGHGRHGLYANLGFDEILDINAAELAANNSHGLYVTGFSNTGTWNDVEVHDNYFGIRSQGAIELNRATVYGNNTPNPPDTIYVYTYPCLAQAITSVVRHPNPDPGYGLDHSGSRGIIVRDSHFGDQRVAAAIDLGEVHDSRFEDNNIAVHIADGVVAGNVITGNSLGITNQKLMPRDHRIGRSYVTPSSVVTRLEIRNNLIYANDNADAENWVTVPAQIDVLCEFPQRSGIFEHPVQQPVFAVALDVGRTYSDAIVLENNTVDDELGTLNGAADSVIVRNNIFAVPPSRVPNATASAIVDYNFYVGLTLADVRGPVFDRHSLAGDPRFVDPAGGDYHLQSITGSFDPITQTFVPTGNHSPAIDAGDPTTVYGNEPAPNGGYVNLGAYGNTSEASLSLANYITVTAPSAGNVVQHGDNAIVEWRFFGFAGSVDLEYSTTGAGGPFTLLAADEPNDGRFDWFVDEGLFATSNEYVLRVRSVDVPAVSGVSDTFGVLPASRNFYVNSFGDTDFSDNEYTTAAGDTANTGLSPDSPKSGVQAILNAFNLEPGDTIFIDSGTSAGVVTIVADDAGAFLQGPTNPLHQASLGVVSIQAANVTLSHLAARASGAVAIRVEAGANNVTIQNAIVTDSATGILVAGAGVTGTVVRDSVLRNNTLGIDSLSASILVENNTLYADSPTLVNDGIRILDAAGTGTIVAGNEVYKDAPSPTSIQGGTGIRVETAGFEVSENTVHHFAVAGIKLVDPTAATQSVSHDNLVHSNKGVALLVDKFGEHFNSEIRNSDVGLRHGRLVRGRRP